MVEIICQGGLGNQLFIVLEAFRQLGVQRQKVVLNLCDYRFRGRHDRPFVMHKLLPGLENYFQFKNNWYASAKYFLAKTFAKFKCRSNSPCRLPGDVPFSIKLPFYSSINYGYFQRITDSSVDIAALTNLKGLYEQRLNDNKEPMLGVHVRRGDYLLQKHSMHCIIPVKSLLEEVKYALSLHEFKAITLFTDSLDLVDFNEFSCFGLPVYVDSGGIATEVFRRLASHSGIIASNSSFSLWAGLLGKPDFFSIPRWWMHGVNSSRLGLPWVRRYQCTL